MSGGMCSDCGRHVPDPLEPCPHCGTYTPVPARDEPSEPIAKSEQLDAVKAALALLAETRKKAQQ